MRRAGQIVAGALAAVRVAVGPGVSTAELDRIAEAAVRDAGGEPSFKGYQGYPATICASINEEIVHGIPGDRLLVDGDVISIDVGAIWRGYQGDAAITVPVGEIEVKTRRLLETTEAALYAGIAQACADGRMGDVSNAIEGVALAAGLDVIREYGGHGIGREMHEEPRIPNWGPRGKGPRLRAGMTLALEPMLTLGGHDTRVLRDGWTVVTMDRAVSAHFEHTIAVTENGAEILTSLPSGPSET